MQIQGKYRCINCFGELNNENESCSCGFNQSQYKVLSHWLFPGTILDNRYYVGRVIGEGGFGITYVGYDENLDMKIAIKEFYLSGINSRNSTVSNNIETGVEEREDLFENYREKFINEAKILAKFNDEEGIVTILNFFKANNTAYIIMEFLDGETLKEYLKRKTRLSVDETLEVFLPIMKTLDDVHTAKLIHRDISPDNIIFTKKGKVKLLDFGAAREVADGNKSLSVVLKHGYAPPEQYQTHGNQGPWTDVYALAATMYKCLTGKTPTEAIDRTLGGELEPVCVITSDCSKEISDVVMKGLEIQVANRYQSMGEMADDLKKAHMCTGDEQKSSIKEDTDATVLIFDENKSDVSDNRVYNFEENKKQDEAPDKEDSTTWNTKDDTTVIDIKEPASDNKVKATNKKPLIWVLAAMALCVIVGLSAMMFAKSGREQGGNADSQVAEEVPQVSADAENASDMEEQSENIKKAETEENVDTEENAEVAAESTAEEQKIVDLNVANVGDIVEFGNYNGFTTWRVLAKNDTELMLITEKVVDRQPFNEENVECDWSSCTLRTWLNEDYYNKAFTDEDKSLIKESDIDGEKDKVFLISFDEARKLFKDDNDRIAHNAEYEKEVGLKSYWWWLRSPVISIGNYYNGSYVRYDGDIGDGFFYVNNNNGVRPALNIDLSNL